MNRALFDTNVPLDVLLTRQPHFAASAAALQVVEEGKVEGYLAGHAITTIAYFLQRELGTQAAHTALSELLLKLRIAPITETVIRTALGLQFDDFEDAVTHTAAAEVASGVIVTRNPDDFSLGTIPAVRPEVFLASLQ